MQGENLKLMT